METKGSPPRGASARLLASHISDDWFAARPRYEVVDLGHGTNCWLWLMSRSTGGYGQVGAMVDGRVVNSRAHRFMYERLVGPVPPELELDHLCRNRACVNPDHLEIVTRLENARRGLGGRIARKLSREEVAALRSGQYSLRALARSFGVDYRTAWNVRNHITYRDVAA